MSTIKKEDEQRVKGMGFLRNRGTDDFSGRLVAKAGTFTAEQLTAVAQCAEKYGSGTVAFTSRMDAEIIGIAYENIEPAKEFLAGYGLYFGGTGPKVRPVVACKGTTCIYGNYDTRALAGKLHDKFYAGMHEVKLPHKFKIGVGGCPNSCVKPSLNDFAIEGRRVPIQDVSKCRGCAECQVQMKCPSKAASVVDGKLFIDREKCLNCGVCTGKCPFGAVAKESPVKFQIYVGGTWGKTKRMGTPISRYVDEEEIIPLVDRCIAWYRENAMPGERLGKTLDRLGMEAFEAAVLK